MVWFRDDVLRARLLQKPKGIDTDSGFAGPIVIDSAVDGAADAGVFRFLLGARLSAFLQHWLLLPGETALLHCYLIVKYMQDAICQEPGVRLVDVDHMCDFWWRNVRCQKTARRSGRACCFCNPNLNYDGDALEAKQEANAYFMECLRNLRADSGLAD